MNAGDPDDPALAAAKAAARKVAMARRAGLDPEAAGAAVRNAVLAAWPPPPGATIAGFWPMGAEIDPRPLMHALHARGHAICLPVTPRRGLPLAFRRWAPGDALVPGPMGTSQPAPEAPSATPDWLIVPLLAFDRAGRRLGYGGGYYDRTLAGLPGATALGIAYAVQEVQEVPAGPHDVRLRRIATEKGVIDCEGPA
ncbi:5-formyltetrahydrofolate cyclo-ligase [Neoroseomonas rubea]|uniref:5-formyltetrahydrofolate cyclo-ligase n=1 Tax=Neoroseomonas rubea TaxID=2748666 RepID=UPI002FCD0124